MKTVDVGMTTSTAYTCCGAFTSQVCANQGNPFQRPQGPTLQGLCRVPRPSARVQPAQKHAVWQRRGEEGASEASAAARPRQATAYGMTERKRVRARESIRLRLACWVCPWRYYRVCHPDSRPTFGGLGTDKHLDLLIIMRQSKTVSHCLNIFLGKKDILMRPFYVPTPLPSPSSSAPPRMRVCPRVRHPSSSLTVTHTHTHRHAGAVNTGPSLEVRK